MTAMQLKKDYAGRDFLSLLDYTTEDLQYFLEVADYLKAEHKAGRPTPYLQGKTMGLIFEKSSTRTRVSFEAGIYYLGGQGLFLSSNDLQIGRGEPIKDTARVLSRFLNGLMIRTFSHDIVLELAQYADIPVINGLTDLLHPCQVLADLQTIREHKGKLAGLKLAFIGDGNNMAHSLMNGGARMGMHVAVACPDGYQPDAAVLAQAQAVAKERGHDAGGGAPGENPGRRRSRDPDRGRGVKAIVFRSGEMSNITAAPCLRTGRRFVVKRTDN